MKPREGSSFNIISTKLVEKILDKYSWQIKNVFN